MILTCMAVRLLFAILLAAVNSSDVVFPLDKLFDLAIENETGRVVVDGHEVLYEASLHRLRYVTTLD